jgi:isocitrate dehydrogenase
MMLRYLDEFEAASKIEHAVLVTLEEGKVKTGDVVGYDKGTSTTDYTDAIIGNLGKTAKKWKVRDYKQIKLPVVNKAPDIVKIENHKLIGSDIFVESPSFPDKLGKSLDEICAPTKLKLKMISNRGTKVYPATGAITDVVDHYRCRFIRRDEKQLLTDEDIFELLHKVSAQHKWMHVEKLREFDGQPSFTKAQGED